jgi:NADH dehydrogenase
MQGLVTVFGGTGFIGRQVVRALAKRGLRVRAAARNVGRGYRLRMLGDVGQIEVVQANLRDPASVARAVEGAEACVNLVGVLQEIGRQGFDGLHAQGAETVAKACAAAGVGRLVQISAIGADEHSTSKYARTKAMGEAAAKAAFPGVTIVRPSIVFGPEDDFFNRFGQMAAMSPALPLIGGGGTKFQPAFVADVAEAVARIVVDPATAGQTYELGGPGVFTFKELMEFVLRETGRRRALVPVPWPIAGLLGVAGDIADAVYAFIPLIKAPVTSDQVRLLKSDNVAAGPGFEALGVTPKSIEAVVPSYLYRYRKGGQYAEAPQGAF